MAGGVGGGPAGLSERVDEWLIAFDRWRSRPTAAIVAVSAGLVVAVGGWWWGRTPAPPPIEELVPRVSFEPESTSTSAPVVVVVHVAGAVVAPGVYQLNESSRITDAISAAGGFTPDADTQQLNLAAPVADGVQIRVPIVGEILAAGSTFASPAQGGALGAEGEGPIDVNRATTDELDALPGVGPATAAAIVRWRDEQGPFTSLDGLLDVPGIGPAKLAALADLIVVR